MKSYRVSLSRLAITGVVTLSTPLVVLKEIGDAHSIIYDETRMNGPKYLAHFINAINTKDVTMVREPYDMQEYRSIARYVNKHYQWKKIVLMQAFDMLLEYTKLEKLLEIHIDFKYGPQTPDHPDSLNACVLYGICKANRIDTRLDTTIDEMAANIKMLFSLRNSNIYHSIRSTINDAMIYGTCDNYQLVNILYQIDPEKCVNIMKIEPHTESGQTMELIETENNREIRIEYNELQEAAANIRLRTIRIKPRTHVEAVAMSAIFYKMDISKVRNPLAEYQELCRTPFFPIDRNLAKMLQHANKYPDSLDNPRLDFVFNPNLPANLYEESDMLSMYIKEGYKNTDLRDEDAYSILQTAYLLPTFIHGKQSEISNTETTMLDEISDLEYDNVVLYGVRNHPMRAYTYGELADVFGNLKRFQMPDGNNSIFSERIIQKLYDLCHKDQRSTESDSAFRERLELGEAIDRVRLYLRTNQAQVKEFVERYERFDDNQKQQVRRFITLLMHSAMYMRGWTGEGPYPLSASDTNVEYSEQPNIDLRITNSIQELDQMLIELNNLDGDFGELTKQLPLIFYHYQSEELLPSTRQEEGLTIYERINIVKGGENSSVQSCVRMSSNRFAASAYYYMRLLSMPVEFNISDLAHIQ